MTSDLWAKQNQHDGDRHRLFAAVGESVPATRVLYPGSFVDVAPSFVWPSVTYVDSDNRAPKFFADVDGVREIIAENRSGNEPTTTELTEFAFIHSDYTADLGADAVGEHRVADESVDLLISLYAGFISESCTRYLRVGGTLLVNPSHGDAAMASIDKRYQLSGIVDHRSSVYRVKTDNLESYLIPKKPTEISVEMLHEWGRGIGYTKSPFAYLFERVS